MKQKSPHNKKKRNKQSFNMQLDGKTKNKTQNAENSFNVSHAWFLIHEKKKTFDEEEVQTMFLSSNSSPTMILRGVCGAVWFGFKAKSHSNCKINKYAVWFGSVDF